MQSSQLYSNTKASAGASTAPNSKDSLAAQLRSLMDSGDTDAAFELLTSKDDKEFDYNEETMTVVTDLVATGILVHPFPSFSHQMNWSSTLNHMPRHFIEKFATDLMERGRYVEAVDILQRRAMVIHRKLRDPNATSIVIPNSLELIQAFATAKTDDIDVEWQLSSWLEWTSIFGDTLIPYICAQSLMTRYPAEIKYQLLFIRTAYVFYLTHKQNGASAQAVADSFLKVLAGLDHDLSPVFRQHMMECLIAAGSIDRAIALGSSSPYLFPWLYHAKIEGKHASYDQETVAAGVPNATSMLECIQWARLAHLNDHPSEAIAIVKELASARTKLSGTDKSLLFLFVSTELPLNPTTFAIMESLTPNAPALLRMVAATAVLHGNPTKGAELLDTAKLFSPESTLTSTLRAMIAENQGRLDEALALNEAIYSEGASIAATSRILRLYLKMGNFEKFISLYGYIARIKERYDLQFSAQSLADEEIWLIFLIDRFCLHSASNPAAHFSTEIFLSLNSLMAIQKGESSC